MTNKTELETLLAQKAAEFDARTKMIEDRERQARRDAYATAAMSEVMRSRETISLDTGEMEIAAEVAYMMADAMEAARLKDWSK